MDLAAVRRLSTVLGKLSRKDAELVILRVAHLRNSEYELQQHRRLAEAAASIPNYRRRSSKGPDAEGLTQRQRVLITATDEFVITRSMSPETWAALSGFVSEGNSSNSARWQGNTMRWRPLSPR